MKNLLWNFKQLIIDRGWFVSIPVLVIWLIILVWPGLQIPPVVIVGPDGLIRENTQTLYLLSSIAQAFAAIVALVFTVSLIAFQLFVSYSRRLYVRFFDRFTLAYIFGYVVVILLAIFLIIEPSPVGVKLCLGLASTCLLLLVPYIMNLRAKFSTDSLIKDLEKQAIREYSKNIEKEPEAALIIENIVTHACALKDYDAATIGLRSLIDTLFKMLIQEEEMKTDVIDPPSYKMGARIMRILENNINDPLIPKSISDNIRRFGLSGVEVCSFNAISTSIAYLSRIGHIAVEVGNEELGGFSLSNYSNIISEWIKNDFKGLYEGLKREDEVNEALGYFEYIGDEAINKKMKFTSYHALGAFSKLADVCLRAGLKTSAVSSVKLLCKMGASVSNISKKDAELACYWLARTGAKSIMEKEDDVTQQAIISINSIRDVIGKEKVLNGLAPEKHIEKDADFKTAYDDFVNRYKVQLRVKK